MNDHLIVKWFSKAAASSLARVLTRLLTRPSDESSRRENDNPARILALPGDGNAAIKATPIPFRFVDQGDQSRENLVVTLFKAPI